MLLLMGILALAQVHSQAKVQDKLLPSPQKPLSGHQQHQQEPPRRRRIRPPTTAPQVRDQPTTSLWSL